MSGPDLAGQVAVVTGAGRGIGRHLALGLTRQGMTVALLGRDRDTLAETARQCDAGGGVSLVHPVDVRHAAGVRRVVDAVVARCGRIDLLVNNAGIADPVEDPPWQVDPDAWWSVLETNLRGSFNLCRAVLPVMVHRGAGRIVNVNSNVAHRRDARYSAYGTSKAALLALSDTLAGPLAGHGVILLDISPGMVRTEMTATMSACQERGEWTDVGRVVEALLRVARGELDALSGRFLHVGADDLPALAARAGAGAGLPPGARTLRLHPHGPDDPLA